MFKLDNAVLSCAAVTRSEHYIRCREHAAAGSVHMPDRPQQLLLHLEGVFHTLLEALMHHMPKMGQNLMHGL